VERLKVSIITAVYNNKEFIEDCIKSVLEQSYDNIEYIIVDGGSTDGTLDIINKYKDKISKIISEKDRGIYDALNKGIKMATGDIIGILHSDDIYAYKDVIKDVVETFKKENVDSVYGDLCYVSRNDINKVIRYWKAGKFNRNSFKYGWAPPHPTFFVKKEVYLKYGIFDLSYEISADYELMVRFLYKHQISSAYIPKVLVKMRVGGKSSKNLFTSIKRRMEDYKIIKQHQLGGFKVLIFKNLRKLPQFIQRKK